MHELSGTMFYLGSFAGAFVFGFPVGPSSLEMLRLTALQRHGQARSLAAGVAFADAAWALAALTGLHPWLGIAHPRRQGPLFLVAALVCAFLAWRDKNETGASRLRNDRGKHLSRFWMGALLGVSYPLTFGSWVVALAVLRGFGWGVPPGPPWLALFFIVVFLGYFGYLILLRFLFARLNGRLPTIQENRLRRLPRYLLMGLAFLFLGLSVAEFLKES
ncbi:MAG: LysE family transporter [Candidatus Aminicenantes bacterium]|nr:LysE family transporter [Candidatus Aminicenantes bacterium]